MRFNEKKVSNSVFNHEGAKAYGMEKRAELASAVLTTFITGDKFYIDQASEIDRLKKLIKEVCQIDPAFVARLAMFARNKMNMRSVTHLLIGELVYNVKGDNRKLDGLRLADVVCNTVVRVDDMTEIMAYYLTSYGKPIPNSLKKGLAMAFAKFDEYNFAKYNRNDAVSLQDLMNLTHPAARTLDQQDLYDKIIRNTLKTPNTWEVALSRDGNNAHFWENAIADNSIGYMALMRNLRNILKANVNRETLLAVAKKLSDPVEVRKSRQLPFRFYSAYKALNEDSWSSIGYLNALILREAVSKAFNQSFINFPNIEGDTLVAIDISGSMANPVSKNSEILASRVAQVLGTAIWSKTQNSEIVFFNASLKPFLPEKGEGPLKMISRMPSPNGGTDLSLPLVYANQKFLSSGKAFDRIVIISDNENNSQFIQNNQIYGGRKSPQTLWTNYSKYISPDCKLHLLDVMGYGTQQFVGKNVNYLSGWDNSIVEIMTLMEQGGEALIETIQNFSVSKS